MLAIALALGSSACYGVSNFIGPQLARRHAIVSVLVVSQVAALIGCALYLAGDSRRRAARGQHAAGAPGGRGQRGRPDRLLQGGRARTALGGRADRGHRRDRAGGLGTRHRRRPESHPGGGSRARDGRRRAGRSRRGRGAGHRAALPGPARERALGGGLGRGVRRVPHRAPEGLGRRSRLGAVRRAHRARGSAGAMGGTAARRHPARHARRCRCSRSRACCSWAGPCCTRSPPTTASSRSCRWSGSLFPVFTVGLGVALLGERLSRAPGDRRGGGAERASS